MIQSLRFIRVKMEEWQQQLLNALLFFLFIAVLPLHQERLAISVIPFFRVTISQEQISNTHHKLIFLEQLFAEQYHKNLLFPMPLLR